MSVPGATDTVKNANPTPASTSTPSAKQGNDFKEAVDRSTTSGDHSQPSQVTSNEVMSNSDPILLANRPPINHANPTGRQSVPLHQSQGSSSTNAPQTAAPAKPGKPLDMAQMEALNHRVQGFNVSRSPVDRQELKDAQQHFRNATDALKAGDYNKAEGELGALGFPLPAGRGPLGHAASVSAVLLGTPAHINKGGGWQIAPTSEASRQALNDLDGVAAHAKTINRLASAPHGISNPPTETQLALHKSDLNSAGLTSPGSVGVQHHGGGIGHTIGVFRAPDGTIWVTSNEDFHQVTSVTKVGVTQADLDATVKQVTNEQ